MEKRLLYAGARKGGKMRMIHEIKEKMAENDPVAWEIGDGITRVKRTADLYPNPIPLYRHPHMPVDETDSGGGDDPVVWRWRWRDDVGTSWRYMTYRPSWYTDEKVEIEALYISKQTQGGE